MNHSDSFQNLFPFILENIAGEVGNLVGEKLELQEENIVHGSLQKIFSPPKSKFVLTGLKLKENNHDPAHILMDLDTAVDLGGKLIMLPENEISACQKQGKLDGEILDAFSEIVNIIAGIINSTCQEYLPKNKLYFIKTDPEVRTRLESDFLFPETEHSLLSGVIIPENGKPGNFQLFFPHTLMDNHQGISQTEVENKTNKEEFFEPLPDSEFLTNQQNESEILLSQPEANQAQQGPDDDLGENFLPETNLDQKVIDSFLLESLVPVREELETLLGGSFGFIDQQTKRYNKKDLLSRTKGKQVLSKIKVTGDKQGEGYILLPLRDAVFIGATLLLMPPEAITQSIKQGKFEGEVADAFGEIINILVGCYSNRFRNDFPIKLALKKDILETLVPSQVDLNSNQPFRADEYYLISTRIQTEDNLMGPLEVIFPLDVLGLGPDINIAGHSEKKVVSGKVPESNKSRSTDPEKRQQPSLSQNFVTGSDFTGQEVLSRLVVIIGQESSDVEVFQEITGGENIELIVLSPDDNLRQYFNHENLCCIFLFLENVNEQGLAQIIKVRAMLHTGCPLIAAAPEWTQSKVLKAVKYGATDILITPAEKNSVRRKFHKHIYSNQG
ncbi:MAG: hypothetical protein R6U27_12120 [Desulfobacterales bacterium]